MSIAGTILPEFDQEMESTRKMLSRAPAEDFGWAPHPKSMTLGRLVSHLCNLPVWAVLTLDRTALDINPDGKPLTTPQHDSVESCLTAFDANVKAAREWLAKSGDEDLQLMWSLQSAGKTLMTVPRVVCIRSFVLNHMIHHRGQLSVYLRLRGALVPGMYGPSADEAPM